MVVALRHRRGCPEATAGNYQRRGFEPFNSLDIPELNYFEKRVPEVEMIEPDLKYCPQCDDEYRAEIEKCAACNVSLITGREKMDLEESQRRKLESRAGTLDPDDDLVVVRRGPLAEMRYIEDLLKQQRIASLLVGDKSTCGKDRFGNTLSTPTVYDINVRREDALEVMDILEEEHRKTTGLDAHEHPGADSVFNPAAGEACCPACGHTFPTTEMACPDCGLQLG